MCDAPQLRRTDRLLSDGQVRDTLSRAYSGRLATVDPDGWPYIVPLLYVWSNEEY